MSTTCLVSDAIVNAWNNFVLTLSHDIQEAVESNDIKPGHVYQFKDFATHAHFILVMPVMVDSFIFIKHMYGTCSTRMKSGVSGQLVLFEISQIPIRSNVINELVLCYPAEFVLSDLNKFYQTRNDNFYS